VSARPAGLDELIARLSWKDAGARRVAILDLIALSDPGADAALLAHLPGEQDERAAIHIIRRLAAAGRSASMRSTSMPLLLKLYENRATPVAIAHAAILAHDTLASSTTDAPSKRRA